MRVEAAEVDAQPVGLDDQPVEGQHAGKLRPLLEKGPELGIGRGEVAPPPRRDCAPRRGWVPVPAVSCRRGLAGCRPEASVGSSTGPLSSGRRFTAMNGVSPAMRPGCDEHRRGGIQRELSRPSPGPRRRDDAIRPQEPECWPAGGRHSRRTRRCAAGETTMNASRMRPVHSDAPTENDPRWAAVVARDRGPTARSTTRSRRPASIAVRRAARAGPTRRTCASIARPPTPSAPGFRPCRRCKPDQPPLEQLHAATVAAICRVIEAADEDAEPRRAGAGGPASARITSTACSRRSPA